MTDTNLWPQFLIPFERELYVVGALGGILGLMISVCSIAIAIRALRTREGGNAQAIGKASEANLQLVAAIWGVSFGCSIVFFAGLIAAAVAGFFPEETQRQIPVILITCVAVFVSMFAAIGSMILWPERFPFRTAAVSIIIMLPFAGFTAATITPGSPPLLNALDLAEMLIPTCAAVVIFSLIRKTS